LEVLLRELLCLSTWAICFTAVKSAASFKATLFVASVKILYLFHAYFTCLHQFDPVRQVSDVFLPRLMELHKQGKFPYDKMVKFYDFSQINDAVKDTHSGATVKPVLIMDKSIN
jgi:hypothetical protein